MAILRKPTLVEDGSDTSDSPVAVKKHETNLAYGDDSAEISLGFEPFELTIGPFVAKKNDEPIDV